MKRTSMIMATLMVFAMVASFMPLYEASAPAIGVNAATISNVSPGNVNYTAVPSFINFTANVTGLGTNETVYLNLTNQRYAMTDNNGTYYYNWSSGIAEGSYTYWIEVVNATGNTTNVTASSEHYEIIIDATGPVITGPSDVGEWENVVIEITDAVSGVAFANITVNKTVNGTEEKYDLTATNGSITFEHKFAPGTYNYTVYAEDVFGNNATASGQFTVTADTAAPVISNIAATPTSTPQGGWVNITADVTDAGVGVKEVILTITLPDNSSVNYTMVVYNGTYYYNRTYDLIGTYSFVIYAEDNNGNHITSSEETFEITDGTAPEISNVAYSVDNNIVSISAVVTDNVGVSTVTISIFNGTGASIVDHADMNAGDNDTYTYTSPALALGDYTFVIYASDAAGNTAQSNIESFSIVDTEAPVIFNITVNPENPTEGQDVTISCIVTDNIEVATVTITLDGTSYNMTLSGGYWTYTASSVAFGDHSFTITATDEAGNEATQTGSFSAADAQEPTAIPSADNPTSAELGSKITITYTVTDDDNIQSVVLHYRIDNGTEETVTMTANGTTYSAEITLPKSGKQLTYWVVVTDSQGSTTTSAQQTIDLKEAPSGLSPMLLAGIGIIILVIIIAAAMMIKKKGGAPSEVSEEAGEEESEEPEESEESEELDEEF